MHMALNLIKQSRKAFDNNKGARIKGHGRNYVPTINITMGLKMFSRKKYILNKFHITIDVGCERQFIENKFYTECEGGNGSMTIVIELIGEACFVTY